MTELFDFIDDLRELQKLYNNGELRNFDFEQMIQKREREIDRFERDLDGMFDNVPV